MKRRIITLIIFLLFTIPYAKGQIFTGNHLVHINPGAIMTVNGDMANNGTIVNNGFLTINGNSLNGGTLQNSEEMIVSGDWLNNGVYSPASGKVTLNGSNQLIGGTSTTRFYHLVLTGTGVKQMEINTEIDSLLDIGNLELNTGVYSMEIISDDSASLARDGGYISCSYPGNLIRNMNDRQLYLFPFGNDGQYQPAVINGYTGSVNRIGSGLYSTDPLLSGFNTMSLDPGLQAVNDEFFYTITGYEMSGSLNVIFYYDTITTGKWYSLADWNNASGKWARYNTFICGAESFYFPFEFTGEKVFSFGIEKEGGVVVDQLVIYNTFTPNEDGINDVFYIENIEDYPENKIDIYNRNGNVVYSSSGYSNNWDGKYYGNDLPAATYYYILNLGDGSKEIKGDLTIIR